MADIQFTPDFGEIKMNSDYQTIIIVGILNMRTYNAKKGLNIMFNFFNNNKRR